MKPNPVTPADIELFDQFMQQWQEKLNLKDWRIIYNAKPAKNAMADVEISVPDHCAVYRIGAHFGMEEVSPFNIEATCCHELLHVLLAEFRDMAEAKVAPEILMAAEHRIVHTLERLLVLKK